MWLSFIVIESTGTFSSENTGGFLYPIFHFLTGVSAARFEHWHHYIRKTGHFVGFFTLSWLLFRSWRATLPSIDLRPWSFQWATIAWLMSTLVAGLDEWHQTFLPSRTGTLHDVALDSAAALTSQLVVWMFLCRRSALSTGRRY